MYRLLAIAAASAAIALPAAASAQDAAGDRVNTVIIYGDDPCPQSTAEEITVCARMSESERYRIPEPLRQSSDPDNQSWTNRVQAFETVGDAGPLSCSPIGAGGELGCTAKMIEAAYAERRQGSDVRFGQLISAARDERLATIDAEAAATQARVEELERLQLDRIRREQGTAEAMEAPARPVDPARLAQPPE